MEPALFRLGTIRELFAFTDWARDKLMTVASGLADEQLDRKFEMGEGSLRATLNHLWSSERMWLDRWKRHPQPRSRKDAAGVTMSGLWQEFRETAAERTKFLAGMGDADLPHLLTYTNVRGETYTFPFGGMMLHVSNHGSHHRAQAVNMIRRVGAALPRPGLDYIFMKIEAPETTPCGLDLGTLRTYFAYGDWANARVLAEAAKLTDEQLNRPFEIGLGTLRKTLVHIRDAEQWWFCNWTKGPGELFPQADEAIGVDQLQRLFAETASKRNEFISGLSDPDLKRIVKATPRPNVLRILPLGVPMLQLNHHGTHHRAQALNMLRHVGAKIPALDVVVWLRERSAA